MRRRCGARARCPWSPIPLAFDGDVGRGIGVADMAQSIRDERPHRASAELAFHVLEVLLALEAGGRVEIESRCERPPPLDRSAQSSDRLMAGQNDS